MATALEDAATHSLERAVQAALVYADLFDYPLRAEEVHRFLPDRKASLTEVRAALAAWPSRKDLYHLPERDHVVERRLGRAAVAAGLWRSARAVGRLLWALPFVEMVAVTGSLAVDNADAGDDIDFMLVTQPGRLWTVRALAVGIVRLGALRGVCICPNYLVTTRALAMRRHDLFTAHELVQLVPLHGWATYQRLLAANGWVSEILPNATPQPSAITNDCRPGLYRGARALAQAGLTRGPGRRFEAWEAGRKIRRFAGQAGLNDETAFTADECKGHFDRHGSRTLHAYAERSAQRVEVRPA
jgi:hypothetical protein